MPSLQFKAVTIKRYRIKEKKLRLLIRCFAFDITASQAANLVLVNRNTANRYFAWLRSLLLEEALMEREKEQISDGIEIDESYFGPKRVRGKRGRGAGKKIIVLGLLKRRGRIYAQIIDDASMDEILPIIKATVKSGADIYTDGWRSYNALAVYGYNHKKVKHEDNEFVRGEVHVNGVESFWSWTKRRLNKFNGIPKALFGMHLLESEWRFNHRGDILSSVRKLARRRRSLPLI